MSLLEVDALSVRYGGVHAVRDLSLTVPDSGIVALLGANGAGKTTSLRAITGLTRPASGTVRFAGEDITGRAPHRIVEAGLVHVPQGRRVFGPLTVEENLMLGAYNGRAEDVEATLGTVYEMFPILAERRKLDAGVLSGGEQQMLAFGRALMGAPRLIAMDEPSMGLAPMMVDRILASIREIADRGLAVLLVEQNVSATLEIADSAYVVDLGEVRRSGTPDELARFDLVGELLGTVAHAADDPSSPAAREDT